MQRLLRGKLSRVTSPVMRRTMAVRVRYNSWCISFPSFAKQQREMTNSVLSGAETANYLYFYFKHIAVSQTQFCDSFDSDKQDK